MRPWLVVGPIATIALYLLFALWNRRRRSVLTLPVLATSTVLIAILASPVGDLDAYEAGTRPIAWLLGPATVALAVPLARQRALLRRHLRAVLGAVAIGAVVGALSAAALARAFGLSRALVATLAPKSVTTPIAMPIAERAGGIPPLAAAIVVVTGVIGMVIGPPLLDRLGIRSAIARGVALGTSSHGVGTAKALEEGEAQGASAGVAMVIAGLVTALIVPWIVPLFAP